MQKKKNKSKMAMARPQKSIIFQPWHNGIGGGKASHQCGRQGQVDVD